MKRTTAPASNCIRDLIGLFTASAVMLLVACNDVVGPRTSLPLERSPRFSSEFLREQISYLTCGTDPWTTDIVCDQNIPLGDGTAIGYRELRYAAWSPDAVKIAGETNEKIGVLTVGDGNLAMLSGTPGNDVRPSWSPDGRRIAFTSMNEGASNIYSMNADGSNVTRLTNGVAVGVWGNPDWSPDGSRILFDCEVEAGNGDLCAINADGSGLVRLTADAAAESDGDWSPDGTMIVFASDWYIAVVNANGSNVRLLGGGAQPAWSPAGARIAFTVWQSMMCDYYCDHSVYIMNADGSNAVKFGTGSQPAWRPATGDSPPPPDRPPYAYFYYSCSNLTCNFINISSDDHEVTQSSWNYGDGTADGPYSWHTYSTPGTYQVTLTVSDALGQTSSATNSVTVPVAPPPPQIGASCNYLTCQFQMYMVDSYIVSQQWTFGDGTSSTERNPSHTYSTAGTYQVSATVTNGSGQTSTASLLSVTVFAPPPPPPDLPPVARFTYTCSGTSCTFDGRLSTDDIGIASYTWSLGTAGTASGPVVSAKFKGRTLQTVTLTVRDTAGHASSTTSSVSVK